MTEDEGRRTKKSVFRRLSSSKISIMLPQAFYARSARELSVALLGKRLVRSVDGQRVSGLIVETEAYCDSLEPDLACHGTKNKGRPTPRTEVMFGPAGYGYVYFTYGMHWMFNVVSGREGQANAVLVRALEPVEGEPIMAERRAGRPRSEWTNGPAKLAQALGIDKRLNGVDLTRPGSSIWLEDDKTYTADQISTGPRIGMGKTPEPWYSMPWRYWVTSNSFVSR